MQELDCRILKSIISDKFLAIDFASTFNHDLFSDDNKLFAKLLLGYIKSYKTSPTKRTLLEWAGEAYLEDINNKWEAIDLLVYNIKEYPFDLGQLKKRYMNKTLTDVKNYIENSQQSEAPEKMMKDISIKLQNIRTIQQGKSYVQKTVKDYVDDFEAQYKASVENPEILETIKCGFSGIDFATGGFKPGDLFFVAAQTGVGKSQMLLNMGVQMWMQQNTVNTSPDQFTKGYNVIIFSLEMPYDELYQRFLAKVAQVSERTIASGKYTTEQHNKILKAQNFIKNYPYEFEIIDIPRGASIDLIELRLNDSILKFKPHVCIVDYLGIMSGIDTGQEDWLKLGETAKELHAMGRQYGLVMGSALQTTDLQRGSATSVKDKSQDQRIGTHRIGRSGQILLHATLAIQIEQTSHEATFFNYHIIKNRRGPLLMASVNKDFEKASLNDIEYVPGRQRKQDDTGPKVPTRDESLLPDISKDLQISLSKNKIAEIKKSLNHQ